MDSFVVRRCSKCKKDLEIQFFKLTQKRKGYIFRSHCIECVKESDRNYSIKNKEKRELSCLKRLKRKYESSC